ncbi:MAG: putative nucleotidyltransferase substrate binding domain-containing protein [Syntrophorhabdales bacterium]|jgi:signal-transduction protein with cAMP-binding, CBS, and nucleotidyltransferase domain
MALNFSIVDRFVSEYGEIMHDKTLLRHDRHDILVKLRQALWEALRESERFEAEFARMLESIDSAKGFDVLRKYHATSVEGIKVYFEEEQAIADVHDLFRIVRDRLTIRVLTLVEEEMAASGFGPPPSGYCWIGLGSEGRDEQTFVTDQDNMLVYDSREVRPGDELLTLSRAERGRPPDPLSYYYEEFSARVMERLQEVGFEKCKGGIMPSNEKWRGSVEDWKARIEKTLTQGSDALELLDLIILTDARVMRGDRALFVQVLDQFFSLLKENRRVMNQITETAVTMPTALGFFSKFRLEAEGDHKGMFNLKVFGWSPLIMSVRALALTEGLYETNTIKRIKRLREMNMMKKETASDLIESYLLFARFRIMNQLGHKGDDGLNYIDPAMLSGEESGRLRKAMRTVETFQKYLHEVVLFGQPF